MGAELNGYELFRAQVEKVCNQNKSKASLVYVRDNGSIEAITYKEILDGLIKTENLLYNVGLKHGDRIAVVSSHSPNMALAMMSVMYCNYTAVLIDASLPEIEIRRLIELSDVRAVFTTNDIFKVICDMNNQTIPYFLMKDSFFEFELIPKEKENFLEENTKDPEEDVMVILFSSGTTSTMKGVKHTYLSIYKAWEINIKVIGINKSSAFLHVLPFNHIAGFNSFFCFFLTGCKIGMQENIDSSKLQNCLQVIKPSAFLIVPKVYEIMEQKIRLEIKNKGVLIEKIVLFLLFFSGICRKYLKINVGKKLFSKISAKVFGENIVLLGTGSSICKKSTSEFFMNMGMIWANFYATTETNVPTFSTGVFDNYPAGTVGKVTRNKEIELRIFDEDKNGIGEIGVKSELMMKGYFRDQELTREAFRDGYFLTGDKGYVDEKEYLHIVGRIKESIHLHNGKKVSPSDIEDYYSMILENISYTVCGILNQDTGYDDVYLFISTNDSDPSKLEEICERIERYSMNSKELYRIKEICFIEKIPVTSIGKVKRYLLKEMINCG